MLALLQTGGDGEVLDAAGDLALVQVGLYRGGAVDAQPLAPKVIDDVDIRERHGRQRFRLAGADGAGCGEGDETGPQPSRRHADPPKKDSPQRHKEHKGSTKKREGSEARPSRTHDFVFFVFPLCSLCLCGEIVFIRTAISFLFFLAVRIALEVAEQMVEGHAQGVGVVRRAQRLRACSSLVGSTIRLLRTSLGLSAPPVGFFSAIVGLLILDGLKL